MRAAVIARDGMTCRYCKRAVVKFRAGDKWRPDHLHLDHAIPWAMGGRDDADNLVVSCASCNLARPRPPAGSAMTHRDIIWERDGDEHYWRKPRFRPPDVVSHRLPDVLFTLEEAAEILSRSVEDILMLIVGGTLKGTAGTSRPIRVAFPRDLANVVERRMDELGWEAEAS